MKKKLVLIGGGGHCKSCIDVIEMENRFSIAGVVDSSDNIGNKLMGYHVIGCDDDLPELSKKFRYFLITIGQIKSANLRIKLFNTLSQLNCDMPVIISPKAYVAPSAKIGKGTIVMHNALVNSEAVIGNNCILNTGSLIEHDVIIGSHSHISTMAVVNGGCKIGDEVFIGSNAVLHQCITIKSSLVIPAGKVVNKNYL